MEWTRRAGCRKRFLLSDLVWALGLVLACASSASAASQAAFGPEDFVRQAGRPAAVKRVFRVANPASAPWHLRLDNGGSNGQFTRASDLTITLNGAVVVRPSDLGANARLVEKSVSLSTRNELKVELRGAPGIGVTLSVFSIDEALSVHIVSPLAGSVTRDSVLAVTGSFTGSPATIEVNGVSAVLGSGTFSAAGIPLAAGNNRIVASASGAGGSASDSVQVRRDNDPPLVVIETPRDGERLILPTVTIAGTVNDIIPGATVNSDDVAVTINGRPAAVDNRTFTLPDLALSLGTNRITATAVDRAGNSRAMEITVTREPDLAGLRLAVASGNNQRGPISTLLAQPLAVVLTDAEGLPLAGRPVYFEVSKGDGLLGDPAQHLRQVPQLTDANGRASIPFTLGSRTGEGFHRVRATTPGSLTFAELCQTAEPAAPTKLAITLPVAAHAAAGQRMADPLSVIVTDLMGNPVPGIPVTFRVERGGGSFGASQSLVVPTNADGIALATWTLGPDAGVANNQAAADFPGNPGLPALFVISSLAANPGGVTRLTGVVQNSVGEPIVGATASLSGTALTALTGPDGRFTLANVPSGEQRVAVQGGTADDPAHDVHYPRIELALQLVPGAENEMDRIVILPFLDMDHSQIVGGDEDVVLGMAGVPGFGIKVFAHSTIRPDGTRGPIRMSSSQVKFDKVPMPPPRGSTAFVIGTLQPGGVLFDPPAQVTYPNVEGLAPGDVADVFAFHHEVGQFVNVGPGTVSADGSVVTSDPGFGLVESGWHCLFRIPGPTADCANGCSAQLEWQSVKADGSLGPVQTSAPISLCTETDANKAKARVIFSPGGGSFDSPTWTSSSAAFTLSDTSASGSASSVTVTGGNHADSGMLTTPVYRIPLPPDQGGDKTCQAQVPVATNEIRFLRDNGNTNPNDDTVLSALNVSNFVTTDKLAVTDGHEDTDNFKIELMAPGVTGNTIPAADVQLEALKSDSTSFNPKRALQVALTRIGTSDRFRSDYLRLVVDGVDQAAKPQQTLLVDWDTSDDTREILGQKVRAAYMPAGRSACKKEVIVGENPRTFKVAVHWLTGSSGVSNASSRQRVLRDVRRIYAQTAMRPILGTVENIAPVQNFASVSHNTGKPAMGGGEMRFTVMADRGAGNVVIWSIRYVPVAGATPKQTADALRTALQAAAPTQGGSPTNRLAVTTFENNAIFGAGANRKSADLLIRDPAGGKVTVTTATSTDMDQTLAAPRADASLIGWNGTNYLIGSIQQRALIRNYDSGSDTVDLFVSNTLTQEGGGNERGMAMFTGLARPNHERGSDPIRNNAFVEASAIDSSGRDTCILSHEIGHCLLDAVHVTSDNKQLMQGTAATVNNGVNDPKRIADANRTFDSLGAGAGGDINQVNVMRASGLTSN